MTATTEALVLRQAEMPYGRGKGSMTSKILTDGTRFYCGGDTDAGTPCPSAFVADSFGQVMAHRSGRHGRLKAERQANGQPTQVTLNHLRGRAAALITEIDKLSEQITHPTPVEAEPKVVDNKVDASWKDRAKAAEKELAQIRRTIGRLAG